MRITIKIGSNVLTREDGALDVTRMSALVDQVAWLRAKGHEILCHREPWPADVARCST